MESHSAVMVPAMGTRQIRCLQEGCSSTVQADLTRGKRQREGSPKTIMYKRGELRHGHDFGMPSVPTEQLRRACNTREQCHQGNYFTDSPKLATAC